MMKSILLVGFCVISLINLLYAPGGASTDRLIPQRVIQRSVVVVSGGMCGGVLVDSEHVLTAAHCLDSPKQIVVSDVLGKEHRARIIKIRAENDLVLLVITPASLAYTLSSKERYHQIASAVYVGDEVWIVGAPAGEPWMLSHGYISKRGLLHFTNCNQQDKSGTATQDMLWLDARVYLGNSGGGVFDMQGHLVGIVQRMAATGGGVCEHPTGDVGTVLWGYAAGPQALVDFLGTP